MYTSSPKHRRSRPCTVCCSRSPCNSKSHLTARELPSNYTISICPFRFIQLHFTLTCGHLFTYQSVYLDIHHANIQYILLRLRQLITAQYVNVNIQLVKKGRVNSFLVAKKMKRKKSLQLVRCCHLNNASFALEEHDRGENTRILQAGPSLKRREGQWGRCSPN